MPVKKKTVKKARKKATRKVTKKKVVNKKPAAKRIPKKKVTTKKKTAKKPKTPTTQYGRLLTRIRRMEQKHAKTQKPKAPRGRPRKEISPAALERAAIKGVTLKEVARLHGISYDTLHRRMQEDPEYAIAYDRGRAQGNELLRAALFDNATKRHNVTAQTFLAKNRLGMRDKIEHTGDPEKPVVTATPQEAAELVEKLSGQRYKDMQEVLEDSGVGEDDKVKGKGKG